MRVVLDTNVVASALLWGGTPERLIQAAADEILELFASEALIAELAGVLERSKFAAKLAQLKSLAVGLPRVPAVSATRRGVFRYLASFRGRHEDAT